MPSDKKILASQNDIFINAHSNILRLPLLKNLKSELDAFIIWMNLILVYNIVFTTVAIMVFEYVVQE